MAPDIALALVGGGHAHIEVIRRFRAAPIPGVRLRVFDPNARAVYSGMVPGFVAGNYERGELEIDLVGLCAHEQIGFLRQAVASIDAHSNQLHFADGSSARYDIASLDIGSTVAGADLPGVREFALASRPIDHLISEIEAVLSRAAEQCDAPLRIRVVGAGAGGVELAFCVDARLRLQSGSGSRSGSQSGSGSGLGEYEISLITSDPAALHNAPPTVRRAVERALERRGIEAVTDAWIGAVRADSIELENGARLPSDVVFWVTGPAAHPLASLSELPCDSRGFIRVRPTLQVEDHDNLFAVGDCASLAGMKKAGVYAVRGGPLLDDNLRALLAGTALREYTPQADFLSLLNLGDGSAIGSKWGFVVAGRTVMRLKDRIDRSFIQKYR